MKRIFKANLLAFLLFTFAFMAGCNNEEIVDPATKANIIGSVNLYDEGTNLIARDGMKVWVVGSNPLTSSITDANGSFNLVDVPFGVYSIGFEKAGFGTYKMINVVHSNTGSSTVINPSPSLGQISTTTISGLTSEYSSGDVNLGISTNPAPTNQVARYIRVFYSKNPAVSFYNYTSYSKVYKHMANPAYVDLGIKALMEMGFTSGDLVYARVYGDSFWGNDFDNVATGKREFPNLNSSTLEAVSFIVP